MSSTNVTPVPAQDNSAAPQIAAPAPQATPDLSALTQPGSNAQPNAQTAALGSMQEQAGQMSAAAMQAAKDAAVSTANPNPPRHAVLLKMIEGLGIGLSSASTAMATKGREGGAPEVQAYYQQKQQGEIQAQQARQQAKDAKVKQDLTTFDTAHALFQTYQNLATVPDEITKFHLDVANAQQEGKLRNIETTKAAADFQQTYGVTADQYNSLMGGGNGTIDPQAAKNLNQFATQKINAAAQILGADYPTVTAAQQVLADPKSNPAQLMDAVGSVNRALALKGQTTEAQIKQGEAAKTAPFGQAKADSLNAAMQTRWQVLQPGQPLPDAYRLNANSTPDDFNRMDKTLQQSEQAQATKTQQGIIDGMRTQTLALSGLGPIQGDATKSGADYLASLPPQDRSLVQSVGTGRIAADRLGFLIAKNPRFLAEVTQAYPDFDSSKAAAYPKTYVDFTSGKTSQSLNAGATALKHLNELDQLNTPASVIPGTPAHTAYMNKLNTVASELVQFYHMNGTDMSDKAVKEGLGALTTWNRRAAIRTQAGSMGDKFGSFEQQWDNSAPSAVYENQMPTIDPEAKTALQALDPNFVQNHPRWAPSAAGSSAPSPQTQAPPTNLLKEGVNTTFKNGQTWTLRGGVPTLVSGR
jgi:hypothetical protein